MQLSKREKSLLLFLGVLLIGAIYYLVFLQSLIANNNKLKENLKSKSIEYEEASLKVQSLDKVKSDAKGLNSIVLDKAKNIYPKIIQEKLIVQIDNLLKLSDIKGAVSFSKAKEDPSKKDEDKKNKGDMDAIAANIEFEGKYENIITFLKQVENSAKLIAVPTITLTDNVTGVKGNIQLEFYSSPSAIQENDEYLAWTIENPYGKSNPFGGKEAILLSNNANKDISKSSASAKKSEVKEDLSMTLRSSYSDLPSFILGKSRDVSRGSYIYSTKNDNQKVEIVIQNKDGQYYCKYKNGNSSYPTDYGQIGTSFIPNSDNIILKIYSSNRKDIDDKVSSDISISNLSDKNVNVIVSDDDKTSPRVNVKAEKGNVTISNN
jgi:type IV pilus assembly protein PilO